MTVIDEYLQGVPPEQKAQLERVRGIVRQTVPDAQEVISYGMPGFKYKGKYLVGFAAFKDHLSLFPTAAPVEALREKLGAFKISKGTIQYAADNPIPESIIKELLAIRLQSITNT